MISTRVHPDVAAIVDAEAERLGVYKSDIMAHALCLLFNKPEHDPLPDGLPDGGNEQMRMTA
jgi:hypothetical protein